MGRDEAIFEGSRLYRQASEGADSMLSAFAETTPLLAGIRFATRGADTLELRSAADLQNAVVELSENVRQAASLLSPYHLLPVLFELTGRAYFGDQAAFLSHLGPGLKVAAGFLYPEVFRFGGTRSSAQGRAFEFVCACAVLEQLLTLQSIWDLAEDGSAELTPDGTVTTGHLNDVADEFASAYSDRGRGQRLSVEVTRALRDLQATFAGVQEVVAGSNPATVPGLQGTVLARITDCNPAFWCGLLARLLVALAAVDSRGRVAEGQGLALIGSSGFILPHLPNETMQQALQRTFWNQKWFQAQPIADYRYLLVRRPMVRISSTDELFATDTSLPFDSLTSFVERALAAEPEMSSAALAPVCFQSLLSEPFEREAEAMLRAHGFRAGRVSEAGAWDTGQEILDLAVDIGAPPGEIDVLAVDGRGIVIVVECKVLSWPYQRSRQRNLVAKLGTEDSEGFRSKLRKKVGWVSRLERRFQPFDQPPLGIILLDRVFPGMPTEGAEVVMHIKNLDAALSDLSRLPWVSMPAQESKLVR